MDWKKWTVIGITAAVVIALIVLHFVQPQVSYAFFELGTLVSYALGCVSGYIYKKYRVEKSSDTDVINE